MATGNEEVYEELKNVLYTDSAVAGEACGYAMGLVMLGTGSEKAVEEKPAPVSLIYGNWLLGGKR